MGYSSVCHGMKHFGANGEDWVVATDRDSGHDGNFAKFAPGLQFGSPEYKRLEIDALLDAFRAGRYSERMIDGYLFDAKRVIGASVGELVSVIKVYFSQGCIHVRPYSVKERS